jgi:hypothetical protein
MLETKSRSNNKLINAIKLLHIVDEHVTCETNSACDKADMNLEKGILQSDITVWVAVGKTAVCRMDCTRNSYRRVHAATQESGFDLGRGFARGSPTVRHL